MTEVEIQFTENKIDPSSVQRAKLSTIELPQSEYHILYESAFKDAMPTEISKISLWYFTLTDGVKIGAFGMNIFQKQGPNKKRQVCVQKIKFTKNMFHVGETSFFDDKTRNLLKDYIYNHKPAN